MRTRLLLALVLFTSPALAPAGESYPVIRSLTVSRHPKAETPTIHVGGLVATVLRFEKPCDAARTKLIGWEGRFEEPVVGGRTIVLFPLKDLAPEDRFSLVVTLVDGTQIPFTVTSHRLTATERMVDQQVNVFFDPREYEAVLTALNNSLEREDELREKVLRHEQEDTIDSAFAALLAKGVQKLTPFRQVGEAQRSEVGDIVITARILRSKSQEKAAVIFSVTNRSRTMPWQLRKVFLVNSHRERQPFALGLDHEVIPPASSGRIAVVADGSAFASARGLEKLVLTLYGSGGTRDAYVLLDPPRGR